MSIEGRMRANGGVVGHSVGAAKMDVNEDAEMIEDLVKEMAISNDDWADALRARYFARDTDFPLSKLASDAILFQSWLTNDTSQTACFKSVLSAPKFGC
jgi:hypothetical protein